MLTQPNEQDQYRDSNGFAAFSSGDVGRAHVLAHQLLEGGQHEKGYRFLTRWLERHPSQGHEWIHLHWHAAVFALGTGRIGEACDRYVSFIEPEIQRHLALTDAPSLLWRLSIEGVSLDWGPAHAAAAARTRADGDPYVELHHALAFAGAKDLRRLDTWLDTHLHEHTRQKNKAKPSALLGVALALRLFANDDYTVAARLLERTSSQVSDMGGSQAQNALFGEIGVEAFRRTLAA